MDFMSLADKAERLRTELGLEHGPVNDIINQASSQLNLELQGETLGDKADLCLVQLGMSTTAEEALRRAFSEFDANGDGKLSSEEFHALLTRRTARGTEFTSLEADILLEGFDVNEDGKLDVGEFIAALAMVNEHEHEPEEGVGGERPPPSTEKSLSSMAAEVVDIDKDGILDAGEYVAAVEKVNGRLAKG